MFGICLFKECSATSLLSKSTRGAFAGFPAPPPPPADSTQGSECVSLRHLGLAISAGPGTGPVFSAERVRGMMGFWAGEIRGLPGSARSGPPGAGLRWGVPGEAGLCSVALSSSQLCSLASRGMCQTTAAAALCPTPAPVTV